MESTTCWAMVDAWDVSRVQELYHLLIGTC